MKKVLLILLVCFFLIGCNKKVQSEPEIKESETIESEEKIYLPHTEMKIKLTEYGKEIYKNNKYKIVEKKDGEYFLSLKIIKEELGYDTSMIVNPDTHIPCDQEKTGISIDEDNLKNIEYKEEPILIYLYCN